VIGQSGGATGPLTGFAIVRSTLLVPMCPRVSIPLTSNR
jgi:hypothetical protein